jgi:hypothetical protein
MAPKKTATADETAQVTDEETATEEQATEEATTKQEEMPETSAAEETAEKTEEAQPEATGTAEATEEQTTEADQAQESADEAAENVAEATEPVAEEKEQLVYIGPAIPGGKLRPAQIVTGTDEQIGAFLGGMTESYPEIKHLLVRVSALAEASKKVRKKGNNLHKYYEDVAAKATAKRTGG